MEQLKEDNMSIIQGAKAVAEIATTHKDVLVKTGQVGAQEVMKKKSKDEAKVRYADYLAYKNSDEPDVEKFSYDRSQTTGRDWNTIMENIRFHMQKNGEVERKALPAGEEQALAAKILSYFPPALLSEYEGKSDIYKALAVAYETICK